MFVLFPLADLGRLVAEFDKFIADETEKRGRVIAKTRSASARICIARAT